MKSKAILTVLGMTSSKGNSVQTGAYDSTKVVVLVDAREVSTTGTSRGVGQMAATYRFGTSQNLEDVRVNQRANFPCQAEIEFEEVASGNDTIVKSIIGFKYLADVAIVPKQQQKAV